MNSARADRFFASDNSAAVHPKIMEALSNVNTGHELAYGDDDHTRAAVDAVKRLFGGRGSVFFVYNGTGANVAAIAAAVRPYQAVVCTDVSHIEVDECGAAERFAGTKLMVRPSKNGKLTPESVEEVTEYLGVEHHSQPGIVSITQATEVGTVYTVEEIQALSEVCRRYGMYLHMDGARIANAVVASGTDLAGMTVDAGVDLLSFGATKNGIMFGEAVVVFKEEPAKDFPFIRKQSMQLASKMRYIAAQFESWLADDLWLDLARRANAQAARLVAGLRELGIEPAYPVEANGVFVPLDPEVARTLRLRYPFYDWEPSRNIVRLMCSYDLEDADVDGFLSDLKQIVL